uniref:Uncharacterized protein n=2 Tax=Ursus TaxID=9639 RepID=A0A452TTZ2_URSMA
VSEPAGPREPRERLEAAPRRCPRLSSKNFLLESLVTLPRTPPCSVFMDSKQVARSCLSEWTCNEEGVRNDFYPCLPWRQHSPKKLTISGKGERTSVCTGCWRVCTFWRRHLPTAGCAGRPRCACSGPRRPTGPRASAASCCSVCVLRARKEEIGTRASPPPAPRDAHNGG